MAENKQYIRLIVEDDSEAREYLLATLRVDHLDANETFTVLFRALEAHRHPMSDEADRG